MIWPNDCRYLETFWDLNQKYYIYWDGSNYQVVYNKHDKDKSMEKYVEKEIGELKAGDEFIATSYTCKSDKVFRVVDREDYKKVFGQYYQYGDKSDILAYCVTENRFTHFGPKDIVKVKSKGVPLRDLKINSDFELDGRRYYLYSKTSIDNECILLDCDYRYDRRHYYMHDMLVFPIEY